jgi:hypothetical protein
VGDVKVSGSKTLCESGESSKVSIGVLVTESEVP